MPSPTAFALRAIPALFLIACSTPCERLCVRMADYAEECGFSIDDSQVEACMDDQADADDQGACRRSGDPVTLRQEWSCDDLQAFFD